MDNNLVNGWYKCIESNDDWTKGKLYYFENGQTKDDKGVRRPAQAAFPQKYNDRASEYWFEWVGLVPADKKEVKKMKHDTMNDSRINGFYKATKTNKYWSKGRQYYFHNGYTFDDDGDTRPCGEPLKYWTSRTRDWLKKEGLVPATDEMDIFDRVNEAAVNCIEVPECEEVGCPYAHVENCKEQMITDFHALRKMRENRKEQEHEAMPCRGGFVFDNRPIGPTIMVGKLYREKEKLAVYRVTDIDTVTVDCMYPGPEIRQKIFHVKYEGVETGCKKQSRFEDCDEFFKAFEPWDSDDDCGSFDFVLMHDIYFSDNGAFATSKRVLEKGKRYSVFKGRIIGTYSDRRFRNYKELNRLLENSAIEIDENNVQTEDPTEGMFTGYAVCKEDRDRFLYFTKGKQYRFVNGVVKDDCGLAVFYPVRDQFFDSLFEPILNYNQ